MRGSISDSSNSSRLQPVEASNERSEIPKTHELKRVPDIMWGSWLEYTSTKFRILRNYRFKAYSMIKSSWGSPGIVEFKVRAPVRHLCVIAHFRVSGGGVGKGANNGIFTSKNGI